MTHEHTPIREEESGLGTGIPISWRIRCECGATTGWRMSPEEAIAAWDKISATDNSEAGK